MMRETWRNPGKGRPERIAANRLTSSRTSRLRPPRVVSGFELRRRFIQLPGDLAEKLRRAALGLGSDFLFQVLAQAGEFFLHAAAKLFKFVHGIRAPNCAARFRYYRRNVAERPDRFARRLIGPPLSLAVAGQALEKISSHLIWWWRRAAAAEDLSRVRRAGRHFRHALPRVRHELDFFAGGGEQVVGRLDRRRNSDHHAHPHRKRSSFRREFAGNRPRDGRPQPVRKYQRTHPASHGGPAVNCDSSKATMAPPHPDF